MPAQPVRVRVAWVVMLVCLLAGAVTSANAADDKLRTWTDAKGKFTIKAKMTSLTEGVVTLEKEDGTELEIELKKLSPADQKFAADAAKDDADNPFKTKSDDPFKPKAKGGKTKSGGKTSTSAEAGAEPTVVKVNLSSADQISLTAPEGEWKVEIPKPADEARFKPKTAPLPNKSNFFEKLKGVAVNLAAKKAAVGFVLDQPKPAGTTRVVVCDLATGKSGSVATAPGQMSPLALHDDGRQIVMRREEFGFGNNDRLEVWTPKGTTVMKSVSWTPYGEENGGARDVVWAEFLDAETLATSSRAGKVALWKFPDIEPICTFATCGDAVPGLSPDRKLIGYCNGKEMGLFDVTSRQVVAQQGIPQTLQWPYMAFSPSGKQLGCAASDKIFVWDVASGKLERTIPGNGISVHGGIEFPADGFILANSKYLFDIENQLKLWTYDGGEEVRSAGGWTFFGTTDGDKKPGALVAAQIPHPAATDLLKKALTDPSLFVLKAGTTVKINVSGIRDASQQARVKESLTKRLQANGCQAGENGTIELVATFDGPKEKKVSFRKPGDFTLQEYVSKVQFVYQGQSAWESGSSNVPVFMLNLKPGENIVTALKEREKPDYAFFERVELPKFLQKPASGKGPNNMLTLGQTRVSTGGVR